MANQESEPNVLVVLHYQDGQTENVNVETQIERNRETVVIFGADHARREVLFSDLKAVFFLHPKDEQPSEVDLREAADLVIEFRDGERMYGRSSEYSADRNGFFLYPADRSKNDKIFVVNSAIGSIDVV
jgi:hypothetical protein